MSLNSKAINETFKNRNTTIPESFEGFIQSLDTTLVEKSWQSISSTSNKNVLFEETWEELISVCKEIDVLSE